MPILLLFFGLVVLLQQAGSERLVNIALDKTPTQSGTLRYSESGEPFLWNVSNSVDGRTNCETVDYQTYSGTAALDNPWWQLDLGAVYTVHAMHVLGRLHVNNQLTGFRLWTGLAEDSLSIVYRNSRSDYNLGSIWINTSMTAQVIKIDLPKDADPPRHEPGPLVLCEVEVYVLTNDNIKQSSKVSMTDDIFQGYGAIYAIDGQYPSAQAETPETCKCCSVALASQIPWWTIDFGQLWLIGGICITGRRDNNALHQSKDIRILISNTSLTPVSRQSSEQVWTISASSFGYIFQHTFQQPRFFRYMMITRHISQIMTVCEVDFITTACGPGSYGDKCSETCGHCNDSANTCVGTNGTCPSGCLPGYDYTKDSTCKTACQAGHFGTNCNDTCGYCINGTMCNITDGTCAAGCAPGYNNHVDRTCKTEIGAVNKCPPGQYGQNCEGTCGHCIDGTTTCLVTNGTCLAGCASGYDYAVDKLCKTECQNGSYGLHCSEMCGHCVHGATTCLVIDGTCPSGCETGYNPADRTCKTGVNILRAPGFSVNTSQSSLYLDSDSSRAIDGLKGPDPETCSCCSQTQNAEVSWWQVDMGVVLPIGEIVVYGQNDSRYQQFSLSGFSVYLSTSVSFSDVPFVKRHFRQRDVPYKRTWELCEIH